MATKPIIPRTHAWMISKSVLNSFIEDGIIDPRGKSESEILQELVRIVDKSEIVPVVDHTQDWLKKARVAKAAGEPEFSVVCYATWAEHMLNKMLSSLCARCKVTDAIRQTLIRYTGSTEKFIWLSLALASKAPPARQLNQLRRICEARNQYLHYKWKPDSEEADRTLRPSQ